MYSKELEQLVDAVVVDGKLDSNEEQALWNRANKDGVDFNEVMVYVNSKLQKMQMEEDKRLDRHEKERNGIICPRCSMEIPPMTNVCPNCGCIISSSDLSGDKELLELINKINKAIVEVKSTSDKAKFDKSKAECEALLRNANMFYGENKKIQILKAELEGEIEKAEQKFVTPIWVRTIWVIIAVVVTILIVLCWPLWIAMFYDTPKSVVKSIYARAFK